MSKKSKQPQKSKVLQPLKLDLGCGENCAVGYMGVDLYAPSAAIKLNLLEPGAVTVGGRYSLKPWPWKDNTVDALHASHFVEHIPQHLRWAFFEEAWRVLKLDGVFQIVVPNWKSERAYGDMTHQWPPVTAMFFFYLNRGWRVANKLTYGAYDIKANFDHQAGATGLNPAFVDRNQEAQAFACQHYLESYPDMWATLTKKA